MKATTSGRLNHLNLNLNLTLTLLGSIFAQADVYQIFV